MVLTIRPECGYCALSFAEHDVGDGPAFFAITLLGFVVVGFATYAELAWRIALWQNFLFSIGLLALLTPLTLRFFKSYLIGMKYKLHLLQGS